MDTKTLNAIKRECKKLAHELMLTQYQQYDEIWWQRIRITQELYANGREVVAEINRRMPNLLTHRETVPPVDIVSEEYGFESTSDFVDYLLAYRPRGEAKQIIYEQLLEKRLAEYSAEVAFQEIDTVPF